MTQTNAANAPSTKAAMVVALLQSEGGASMEDCGEATGWLPHSCRAFLTGLRKKGYDITRSKVDGVTRYMIEPGIPE
tara:strand:- start:475 stop:705 length:231 start_codon:yes stop_codon:yes gene_type:complete